jgi:dTMP kinase
MDGKLIVIEGLDGSGKSTQEELLKKRLSESGLKVNFIKLPNYDDPACELVKEYLAGRFGKKPGDVNAYAASAFFAVDRFASYNCYWKDAYKNGEIFLADRYTTSNAYHQLTKTDKSEWDSYLAWLEDFEYNKMGIPKPDAVIYLDMPIEVSQKLMTGRYNGDESKKDIHEKDVEYLNNCREAADYACRKLGWERVECSRDGEPLPIEVISDAVYNFVAKALNLE